MWGKIFSPVVCRREFVIWLLCLVVASVVGIVFAIKYATPWQELLASVGSVIVESLLIYGLVLLFRVVWRLLGF